MSIDISGVGGIGIKIEWDCLVEADICTEEEWDDDPHSCLEELGIDFSCAGRYDGPYYYYLFVDGENLDEVNENSKAFIDKLNKLGFNLTTKDLKVISDVHIF